MALYSKKEFAAKCGVTTSVLAVYLKRKKIVMDGDNIDDNNPINVAFFQKHSQRHLPPAGTDDGGVGTVKSPAKTKTQPDRKAEARKKEQSQTLFELEKEAKQHGIEKTKEEIDRLRMQKHKLNGYLIPTDMVKTLFGQHFRAVTVSFKEGADNILVKWAKRFRMNRNDIAELRGEMIAIINESIDKAVDESQKNLSHLVAEYAKGKKTAA